MNPKNGCEVYLANDPKNCGACGKVCSFPHANASCTNGACAIGSCFTGYADCDKDPKNGCEVYLDDDGTILRHD